MVPKHGRHLGAVDRQQGAGLRQEPAAGDHRRVHRRLWINDNDCLLLRPVQTELDAGQRRRLAESIAAGGAFTVASDDLSLYGDEEWALLEKVRTSPDEPLDLPDPFSVHSAS